MAAPPARLARIYFSISRLPISSALQHKMLQHSGANRNCLFPLILKLNQGHDFEDTRGFRARETGLDQILSRPNPARLLPAAGQRLTL